VTKTLFTTEEGIRKLAGDFQLPKDAVGFLINQAAASKDELFRIIAKELRAFLESRIPGKRPGTAAEVARLVASLFGEDNAFLTGATLYLDGGQGMAH